VTTAVLLAEIGEDRQRYPSDTVLLAEAGLAPVTRASGRSRSVRFRYAANTRLRMTANVVGLQLDERITLGRSRVPAPATSAASATTARYAVCPHDGCASSGAAGPTTSPTTPQSTQAPSP
jgi:transposase